MEKSTHQGGKRGFSSVAQANEASRMGDLHLIRMEASLVNKPQRATWRKLLMPLILHLSIFCIYSFLWFQWAGSDRSCSIKHITVDGKRFASFDRLSNLR